MTICFHFHVSLSYLIYTFMFLFFLIFWQDDVDSLSYSVCSSRCCSTRLLRPWDFSRQEYWSGVPLPSPSSFSRVFYLDSSNEIDDCSLKMGASGAQRPPTSTQTKVTLQSLSAWSWYCFSPSHLTIQKGVGEIVCLFI